MSGVGRGGTLGLSRWPDAGDVRRWVGIGLRSRRSGLIGANVGLFAVMTLMAQGFATAANFQSAVPAAAYTGIMAAAATIVLISGGLDLSVGAVMVFSGQALAWALGHHWSAAEAIAACLLVGAMVGVVNSVLCVGFGINLLVATIGMQFVIRGLANLWTNGYPVGVTDSTILGFGHSSVAGIQLPLLLLLGVFLLLWLVMRYSQFGANVYAVGSSRTAARLAGISVWRVRSLAYVLSGVAAALAGIILVGYQGSSIPSVGIGIELTVIAAAILGGSALHGGTGSLFGTLLGVVFLAALQSGLNALAAPSYWQDIAEGAALALAMSMDDFRRRRVEMS